jgi:hypothetical protein
MGDRHFNIKCDKYEVVMVSLDLLRKFCEGNLLCLVHDGICFRSGLRRCRGGALPFPRGAKVPFFIFGKYLRYFKKSLHVRFMRRKLQIMNPLKRVLPQKPAPPPPHTHRSTVPAKN